MKSIVLLLSLQCSLVCWFLISVQNAHFANSWSLAPGIVVVWTSEEWVERYDLGLPAVRPVAIRFEVV